MTFASRTQFHVEVKALVAAFNQEKALVGAFSVITNLWMELFQALSQTLFSQLKQLLLNNSSELSSGHSRTQQLPVSSGPG